MSRARFAAALAVLACVALAGAERARFTLWTTSDEPAHLAAAREWRYGPGMVSNFEHPVLMKVIAGTTLPARKPELGIDETRAGRAPFPFVLALLVVATGLLGRALAGPAAGLAAAGILAVEPTFRGHGTLVQSDILVTLFLVAAAFALERAARAEGARTGRPRAPGGSSPPASSTASRWRRSTRHFRSSSSSRGWRRSGLVRGEHGGFSSKVKRGGAPGQPRGRPGGAARAGPALHLPRRNALPRARSPLAALRRIPRPSSPSKRFSFPPRSLFGRAPRRRLARDARARPVPRVRRHERRRVPRGAARGVRGPPAGGRGRRAGAEVPEVDRRLRRRASSSCRASRGRASGSTTSSAPSAGRASSSTSPSPSPSS